MEVSGWSDIKRIALFTHFYWIIQVWYEKNALLMVVFVDLKLVDLSYTDSFISGLFHRLNIDP